MDGEAILTWNAPNWITVLLMVGAGFFLIASVAQIFQKWKSGAVSGA